MRFCPFLSSLANCDAEFIALPDCCGQGYDDFSQTSDAQV